MGGAGRRFPLPSMLSDLRLTLRSLAKSPGFVAVAVFTLTLGIGVNAAMFGIVNALLLRGLPFPEQGRLYHLASQNLPDGIDRMGMSHLDFEDMRGQQHSFEDLAGYDGATFNVASPGADPERVTGARLSAQAPGLLRAGTTAGRWFQPDEGRPGAAPVVVLGYALWQNRFKGDPAIVGQSVKVDEVWATIVGVAPKGFRFPEVADAWMPLPDRPNEKRDDRGFNVFGRLKPGATPEQAGAEFTAIASRLAADHPDTNKNVTVVLTPLFQRFLANDTRRIVQIMFGAVGLVLLIACANVANLLLARAAVRQKELAIRSALGASRAQVMRLLFTETFLLSLGGAAFGLPLAYGLMAALNLHLRTKIIPYWMVFDIDRSGLGYVVVLAVVTCLVAGLWPAWRMSHTDLNAVLKDGGRGSTGFSLSKFTRVMVIGEVILSSVLLVLSALTIRSVINAQSAALGYRTDGVFTNRLVLSGAAYASGAKQADFFRELMRRLGSKAEIEQAAISSLQPTWGDRTQVEFEGKPRGGPNGSHEPVSYASHAVVSGNYFATLGIKLVAGRTFDERDTIDAPAVALVSTAFADKHWPGESPLGRRFVYGWGLNVKPGDWISVIGVVTPTLQGEFQREMVDVPQTYLAYTQRRDTRTMTLFTRVRGSGDPAALANVVRLTVHELDADQPIFWPQTLEAMVADARFYKGLIAWIFGIFGGVALVLAAVGLYGVMSYSVSQRTQEIGVRMALGAEPRDVLLMILGEGGTRLVIGLALGLVVAYFAGKLLAFILYGVAPNDVVAFGGTLLTLGAAGVVACLVPALRAVRVNPTEALRWE